MSAPTADDLMPLPFFVNIHRGAHEDRESHVYIGVVPYEQQTPATTLASWNDDELWNEGNHAVSIAECLQIVYEQGARALATHLGVAVSQEITL